MDIPSFQMAKVCKQSLNQILEDIHNSSQLISHMIKACCSLIVENPWREAIKQGVTIIRLLNMLYPNIK